MRFDLLLQHSHLRSLEGLFSLHQLIHKLIYMIYHSIIIIFKCGKLGIGNRHIYLLKHAGSPVFIYGRRKLADGIRHLPAHKQTDKYLHYRDGGKKEDKDIYDFGRHPVKSVFRSPQDYDRKAFYTHTRQYKVLSV